MEIIIGHGTDWYNRGAFKVNADKHTALYGESGTGKSVTMVNMAIEDVRAGRPIVFIDPHDEGVKRIADFIPKHRLDDVIWFDPLSPKVIGLNVLGGKTRDEKLKRADQFIDTASKIYGENSWGGSSAYIARNILYAIIEVEPNPNPLHLFEALMSEEYRDEIFDSVVSENLRKFKKKYDEEWKESDRENKSAAPTNKVDTFIANWIIRDMLCQREHTLDFYEQFERNAIILVPLGKGRLGPETSAFLGSLIMQECFFAGLSRERLRPAERKPVRIYIDEFHNFVKTDAADYILSELRKYGISMVAADQNVKVLPRENFISKVVLRVDAESAKVLAQEMAADISDALTRVPNFHAYAQTMREGYKTDAKLIRLREPIKRLGTEYPAWRVIRHSEENHGVARDKVEKAINRFLAA